MIKKELTLLIAVFGMTFLYACNMNITPGTNPAVEPTSVQTPETDNLPKEVTTHNLNDVKETAEDTLEEETPKETWYLYQTKSYLYDGTLGEVLEYNESGQLTADYMYDKNGSVVSSIENTYDDEGKYVKIVTYGKNGVVTGIDEWTVDEKGRKLPCIAERFDENGNRYLWDEFVWDENDPNFAVLTEHFDQSIVKTEEFIFDENGLVSSVEYDMLGKISNEKEYWDNGKIKKTIDYFEDGQSINHYYENEKIKKREDYDASGQLTNEMDYEYFTEDGYDKTISYNNGCKNEYWYVDGKNVLLKQWDENGELIKWMEYEYDKDDKIVSEVSVNPKDEARTEMRTCTINEDGVKCVIKFNENGDLVQQCEYTYDDKNRLIRDVWIDNSIGTMALMWDRSFEYDEYGNLIAEDYYVPYEDACYRCEYTYLSSGTVLM